MGVCDGAGEECWREWEWEYVMGQEKSVGEGVGVGVCDGAGEECWREWEWEYVMGQEKSVGGSGSGSM